MTVAQQVNAERLVVLGWSRAILLQLAHPLLASGVYDHSTFRTTPIAAVGRLRQTIRAMLALTFGDEPARTAALARIAGIHRRVNGTLAAAAGPFPAGTRYSAEDPALVLWVHVTLLESVVSVYEMLVTPLTDAARDAYCEEAASVPIALGARSDDVPRSWKAARQLVEAMHASGQLVVTPRARELAHALVAPPLAFLVAPAASANRLISLGLLPADLRQQYELTWTGRDERALHRVVPLIRMARRRLPKVVSWWPEARALERRPPPAIVEMATHSGPRPA